MDKLTVSRDAIYGSADPVAAAGKVWVTSLFLAYVMKRIICICTCLLSHLAVAPGLA